MICRNAGEASGSATVTLENSGFLGVLDKKIGGKNMKFSQRVTAVRLGDCIGEQP